LNPLSRNIAGLTIAVVIAGMFDTLFAAATIDGITAEVSTEDVVINKLTLERLSLID